MIFKPYFLIIFSTITPIYCILFGKFVQMSIAIRVDHVSKKYSLGQVASYETLSEKVPGFFKKLLKGDIRRSKPQEFWALKDVSFDIQRGDRLGIVGRNGAGKSTLLKILSRIVSPTEGRIEIEGRVSSLLEVGTGFHPELSGRENIFLNGSILGMHKREIKSKFDEIVAFSEIEQFIDSPVKRYSSGMYVRLAFAVAAHLEPDILIVDEVLAVGDAAFQKKCIGKINEINEKEGRTILFVSHSMQAIQKICNTGVFLQKGRVEEHGSIDKVVNRYLQTGEIGQSTFELPRPEKESFGHAYKVYIENLKGESLHEIPVGSEWRVRILFKLIKPTEHFIIGLGITSSFDQAIRTSWSEPKDMQPGEYEIIFDNNDLLLTTGIYKLVIGLSSNERAFQYEDNIVSVCISDAGDVANEKRVVNTQSGLILNPMSVKMTKLN
jgi:lipopolysaccharide transport system ATP-binding protein